MRSHLREDRNEMLNGWQDTRTRCAHVVMPIVYIFMCFPTHHRPVAPFAPRARDEAGKLLLPSALPRPAVAVPRLAGKAHARLNTCQLPAMAVPGRPSSPDPYGLDNRNPKSYHFVQRSLQTVLQNGKRQIRELP
jgi:hypothetical protein